MGAQKFNFAAKFPKMGIFSLRFCIYRGKNGQKLNFWKC